MKFRRVDPYLKIKLGDQTISDKKNHLSNTNCPEFYRAFEIGTSLPGVSRLHLSVWDHNWILRDNEIGETVIDLEDRWFCQKWQRWGEEFAVEKEGPNGKPKLRVAPKPLETFTLRNRAYNKDMGVGDLNAWIDILTKEDAQKYPLTDISPPPPKKFQLRVIVWRTRHVPYADKIAHLSDLYCRAYVENGPPPQCTDIHWRCATGKGSFNWRMLVDIDLPHKYPLMRFQIWDQDVLQRNDLIGEASLDVRKFFGRAYRKKNKRINLFKRSISKKRKKQKEAAKKAAIAVLDSNNKPEAEMLAREAATRAAEKYGAKDDVAIAIGKQATTDALARRAEEAETSAADPIDEEDEAKVPLLGGDDSTRGTPTTSKTAPPPASKSEATEDENESETAQLLGDARKSAEEEAEATKYADNPAYFDDEPEDGLIDAKKMKEMDAGEGTISSKCEGIVTRFRKFFGLPDDSVTPEDAQWIPVFRYDPKKHKKVSGGAMLVSMEIVPESLVPVFAAGKGRSDPDGLPEPTGRISLSLNPFRMLFQILGPHVYTRLCCCLATFLATATGYYMYDGVVNAWLVFQSLLGSASDYSYIFFLMFLLLLFCVCCCSYGVCMSCGHKKDCKCCGVNCQATGGKYCPVCC